MRLALTLPLLITASACASRVASAPQPLAAPTLPFHADTLRTHRLADGVTHTFAYSAAGPWAINLLDVNLDRCTAAVAVKGSDTAAARIKTTVMLHDLTVNTKVLGGVNGDFFALTNGTPTGLLVVNGRMMTPPSAQSVLAFDSAGTAHITTFTKRGNTLAPFYPRDAIGGRPLIVRDSAMIANIDSAAGYVFSTTHHPRTVAGISRDGKHLILAVVDGRQLPYADGMSLRQLAQLMMSLGAYTVLNLDGGGSSTLVYADPDKGGELTIGNHPSDKEGERPVGDAVAIVRRCQ